MSRAVLAFVFAGIACGCSSQPAAPPDGPTTVTTVEGVVQGAFTEDGRQWLGIPYAAPPVGPLRFLPPKDVTPWTTPLRTVAAGHECPQLSFAATPTLVDGSDEDCLYVNVWAPRAAVTNAPVFVWIYGGGFTLGSGGDRMYSGEALAAQTNAIIVTFNYRLGALGWISHPELAAEEGVTTSPSPGLLDQQAALRWVQRNIAAFGGDPTDVTLAGESAGAISVCAHLAAPGSRGLFQRAIVESGICQSSAEFATPAAADDQGSRLAAAVGCTTPGSVMSCLRATPPETLLAALPTREANFGATGDTFGPVVDGTVLPTIPLDAIRAGQWAAVPTILGSNVNEGDLFMYLWTVDTGAPPTSSDLRASLAVIFDSAQVDQIAAQYPVDTDPVNAFSHIITEGVFACSARRTARAIVAAGVPAYLYQFTYPYVVPAISGVVAGHSFEIPFVFRNGFLGAQMSDEELAVADQVDGYWFRFAQFGDPNGTPEGGNALVWPAYDAASDQNLVIDSPVATNTGLDESACDFWDTIMP
jgi:para-nitrobenzyl esterase